MRKSLSSEELWAALIEFVEVSDDLRAKAYTDLAKARGWPAVSVPTQRFRRTFGELVWTVAQEHGVPERSYRWATCPKGFKHAAISVIHSTVPERLSGECRECDVVVERRQAWLSVQPTFRELHPYAVGWLVNAADADSRAQFVDFRCTKCGDPSVRWAPKPASAPKCHYCRTVGTAVPGDLIGRRGGGARVQLEHDVASALVDVHGLVAEVGKGIVVPKGSIIVSSVFGGSYPLPVVKPDIVLGDVRVALELDFDGRHSSHSDPRDLRQDQERDTVLAGVGWSVLRVREPGAPSLGAWPWKIETKSRSARRLAVLVVEALDASSR